MVSVSSKDNISNIEAIHSLFIYDLATDYTLNYSLYTKVKVKEILLLGKDGQYHKAKELTEGTAYQPRCNLKIWYSFDIFERELSACRKSRS